MLYIFKIVSFLTFLKIVLLLVIMNCKNFAILNSTSLQVNDKLLKKNLRLKLIKKFVKTLEIPFWPLPFNELYLWSVPLFYI